MSAGAAARAPSSEGSSTGSSGFSPSSSGRSDSSGSIATSLPIDSTNPAIRSAFRRSTMSASSRPRTARPPASLRTDTRSISTGIAPIHLWFHWATPASISSAPGKRCPSCRSSMPEGWLTASTRSPPVPQALHPSSSTMPAIARTITMSAFAPATWPRCHPSASIRSSTPVVQTPSSPSTRTVPGGTALRGAAEDPPADACIATHASTSGAMRRRQAAKRFDRWPSSRFIGCSCASDRCESPLRGDCRPVVRVRGRMDSRADRHVRPYLDTGIGKCLWNDASSRCSSSRTD
jgi:hypothetical protein